MISALMDVLWHGTGEESVPGLQDSVRVVGAGVGGEGEKQRKWERVSDAGNRKFTRCCVHAFVKYSLRLAVCQAPSSAVGGHGEEDSPGPCLGEHT